MSGQEAPTAQEDGPSTSAPSSDLITAVQARLAALSSRSTANTSNTERKPRYAFWETQPVVQFDGQADAPVSGRPDAARGGGFALRGAARRSPRPPTPLAPLALALPPLRRRTGP